MTRVGLVDACRDPQLFAFPLWPRQEELLASVADCPRQVWALGRRSGKSTLASVVALHNCLFRPELDACVRPGEVRYAVVIATNRAQARLVVAAARSVIEASPLLAPLLVRATDDELEFLLPSGARSCFAAFACSSRGARGWPISALVMDEAAHFLSETDGPATAQRVWEALRPASAQFGDAAQVIVSSSPLGPDGFFAVLFRRADGGEMRGWRAHRAASAEMNPTLTDEVLAALEAESPESFPSEYLADFESGSDLLFDRARFEPAEGLEPAVCGDGNGRWIVGLDPAFSADSFGIAALSYARLDPRRMVLGTVAALRPAHVARGSARSFERKREEEDEVLAQVAGICREYEAAAVLDQHQSQAIIARLRDHHVSARVLAMTGGPTGTKWAAWREFRDRVHDGSLVLPAREDLLREVLSVRWKIDGAGPRIILPRSARGHCDQAQALAVAVYELRFGGGTARRRDRTGERQMPITARLASEIHGRPLAAITRDTFDL